MSTDTPSSAAAERCPEPLARQRLAHRLAEAIEREWPDLHREGFDLDEARRIISMHLPMTAVEAEAEMAGMDDDEPPVPSGPSVMKMLRDALRIEKGTICLIIQTAAERIRALEQQLAAVTADNAATDRIIADLLEQSRDMFERLPEADKYEFAARCRNQKGLPCWCGCHITETGESR